MDFHLELLSLTRDVHDLEKVTHLIPIYVQIDPSADFNINNAPMYVFSLIQAYTSITDSCIILL